MTIDIDSLTEAELVELHHQIVAKLRKLEAVKVQRQLQDFKFGDRVAFVNKVGQTIEGMVVRCLKTTVTLVDDSDEHWKVSPSLLRKIDVPVGYVPKPIAELNRLLAKIKVGQKK
jgi:hypothetical protein